MSTENIIRALAGSLVLASLALAHFVHPGFLYFTAFVGFNLLQSAFTGLCPAESILRRLRPASPSPASGPQPSSTAACCGGKPGTNASQP